MLARSAIARALPRCSSRGVPAARRGMAALVANPFHFSESKTSGLRIASRDDGGPTSSVALVVRGGSRHQPAPGLAHGLQQFAFKNTSKRSSLRLTREVELLGGSLSSALSRENIVLNAKFLRDDLPYFVEALADVLTATLYKPHEFNEEVAPTMGYEVQDYYHDPAAIALETAHNVAFHSGLGSSRLALSNKYLSNISISEYAKKVYTQPNIALVGAGVPLEKLEKWADEFLKNVPTSAGPTAVPTKYYGGENRVFSPHGDALVLAFPGSQGPPTFKAELAVLAYLLGGQSATKWNPGTSLLSKAVASLPGVSAVARHNAYSDAGLLYITVTGPTASLTKAAEAVSQAVHGLGSVTSEDVAKAVAQAKFDVLATAEDRVRGLEIVGQSVIAGGRAPQVEQTVKSLEAVNPTAVKNAAKTLLDARATFAAVGDLDQLPFASDIGVTV